MWFLAQMVSWISSSAFTSLANGVVSVLNKKQDTAVVKLNVDGATNAQIIQAGTAAMHEQAALATLRWGWWGTRYLMLAAALPPVIHSGAIYLDSTFRFGWAIPRAPGVYEGQELQIIAVVVGILTVQSIGGGFLAALKR